MARIFTPQDVHILMNQLVRNATGQKTEIEVVDTSSFVSAGETVLATGMENTLNAISMLIGQTLIATRPYRARFWLVDSLNTGVFTNRLRKLSFYAQDALASGDWNTQLFTNLEEGYTNGENGAKPSPGTGNNSTKSMWEQHRAMPLEMNFAGQSVWEDCLTTYEYQLKQAFRNEEEFALFFEGALQEKENDIESQKEAFNNMTVLNAIGMTYNRQGGAIDLTSEFNTRFGTTYTGEQIRNEHLTEFSKFFVAYLKNLMRQMERRTALYHNAFTKNVNGVSYSILRHTPRDKQRLMLYSPLFTEVESNVFPSVFNDQWLQIDKQYEPITYWQNPNDPSKVHITPAVLGGNGAQGVGTEVELPYVVGFLFDKDGVMTNYQLERTNTTPLEARKAYYNTWWSFSRNAINDPTENMVVFYMS